MTEITKDSASLSWDEPESDGGSPITSYLIEKQDVSKTAWISAGHSDAKKTKISKLFEGTTYNFRVAAENKIGVGEFATTDDSYTAKLPFSK